MFGKVPGVFAAVHHFVDKNQLGPAGSFETDRAERNAVPELANIIHQWGHALWAEGGFVQFEIQDPSAHRYHSF